MGAQNPARVSGPEFSEDEHGVVLSSLILRSFRIQRGSALRFHGNLKGSLSILGFGVSSSKSDLSGHPCQAGESSSIFYGRLIVWQPLYVLFRQRTSSGVVCDVSFWFNLAELCPDIHSVSHAARLLTLSEALSSLSGPIGPYSLFATRQRAAVLARRNH